MANVKVAVRVRPLSKREHAEGRRIIVEVEDKVAKVRYIKVDNRYEGLWDAKEKVVAFGFDYCYSSVDPDDPNYASQEVVFQDLGTSVLSGAFKGYNICLFAYGQTGSGKTHTMMGTPASIGLTPRICEGLFSREDDCSKQPASCRVEVSFLEIYNERVRDLLRISDHKKPYTLRVREHPETGPYVQGLSRHVVADCKQVIGLLEEGIANRITAATHVHDASSRSHAIFTIQYTQAILENNLPSEIASKINLVDLAGSERADPSYCKDRITEGANINKSLVTLGIVISALAQNSQMFSSCQSINSIASEVDSSHTDSHYGASVNSHKRQAYIPYRDSVLTWLLKDSLGGNSKTIMIATISPASSCYNETMSTLRYASNAKNIINKPRVNEDANVKLIRELREEIDRLKAMLMSFELRNSSPSWSDDRDGNLTELVLQNELKIEQLTKDWTDKWINRKAIMEEYSVDINKKKAGVVIDSNLPHLMAMDDDILSTGVVLYHLREGTTKIGRSDSKQEQDIVLQGQWIERDHCLIDNQHGIVTLRPFQGAPCNVNGHEVTDSFRLSQGALVVLGKAHKFRFNHPAEAAVLRQRRSLSETSSAVSCSSLEWLDLDGDFTSSFSCSFYTAETENSEQKNAVSELKKALHSRKIRQQQLYVEELQQQIVDGQIKTERELEHDQAALNQQIKENLQWLYEEQRLAVQQQESAVQTEVKSYTETGVQNTLKLEIGPTLTVQNKKKLVQLELLRKCSLKKAERNFRRKKVKLHLERIVKKQKLLEAKKNLEQLEAICWICEDNGKLSQSLSQDTIETSQDCKHPRIRSGSDLNALQCNRNSFLNLHLPHLSTCGYFLKRDPSSEFSTSAPSYSKTNPPRKSLSIEYLPRTVQELSARDKIRDERDGSFPTQRQLAEILKLLYLENKGVDNNSRNIDVISNICKGKKMDKVDTRTRQSRSKTQKSKSCSPDHFKKKSELETGKQVTKAKILGDSNQHTGKPLEKSGTQETNRKSRTDIKKKHQGSHPGNSSKETKLVCGKVPAHHLSRTSSKNVKKDSEENPSEEQHEILREATSARSLNNIHTHTPLCHGEKRWHSAEVLSAGTSKAASDPLWSWQEDGDIEFSDTDSTYSVDSLSCVTGKVLEEQLRHEESTGIEDTVDLEGSESDDSQMSQDSLSEKEIKIENQDETHSPEVLQEPVRLHKDDYQSLMLLVTASESGNNLTERSFSLDSLGDADEVSGEDLLEESKFESFDEVPAEVFWRLQNSRSDSIKSQKQHCSEISNKTVRRLDDLNLNTNSFYLDASMQSSSSSICDESVKEIKISFSGQEASLAQRSDTSNNNLPNVADAWLSHDLKHGKSSPIIAMPSSQDCSEFQVAQLHPVGKSNCWVKKEDLRQSAAELSFVSCSEQPHRASREPSKTEMLFSSVAPSVPFPESQKHFATETPGIVLSVPNSAASISLGNVSTFPIQHSCCEVASPPPTANNLQPDTFSERGSTDDWRQTSSSLKEVSDSNNLSQMSERQDFSDSSVYPEMLTDQNLQQGEDYVNTNFKDCLFRTIEKEDIDSDSDNSMKDSNLEDKHTCTLSIESLGLASVCTTQENGRGHKHLFPKEGTSLVSDESFYLCDLLSKDNSHSTDGEEEKYSGDKTYLLQHGSNFDLLQRMRYQQVSTDEIAVDHDSPSENELYQTHTTAFCHSGQFALPIQTSEAERENKPQENRDALTESALEAPSFREVEENKALDKEWSSDVHFECHTKALMNDPHSGLKAGYSGNCLNQEALLTENAMGKNSDGENYETVSFSRQKMPLPNCMNLVLDESVCSNLNVNEKTVGEELSVIGSCDLGNKLQSNSNVCYQDIPAVKTYVDCSEVGLHSSRDRNCIEKDSGTVLGSDGRSSVIASQEQHPHVNKESDHLKETITTGGLSASEDNKNEPDKVINSEELAKLINSVNQLESGILEMKSSQSLQNYIKIESPSEISETGRNFENYSLVQRPQNEEEECNRKLLVTETHEERGEEKIQPIDVSKEEMCASNTTDSIVHTRNINQHKIQGHTKGSDCLADVAASSKTTVPALSFSSTVLTQTATDTHETYEERSQVDRVVDSEGFVNTESTEPHMEENLVLLPESPAHDLMHCNSNDNGTNSDDAEILKTYFVAAKLDEQESKLQLPEAGLGTDEAHEERSPAGLWTHTGDVNKILKDRSNNDSSSDSRAVTKPHWDSEEFKQVNNADSINTSQCLSTTYPENGISEHCVNFVENKTDIYKCVPVHCVPEEKETLYPTVPISVAKPEVLIQSPNTQNMFNFQTEKNEEDLEEKSPEMNVSQNEGEGLPENRCSYWLSKNETLLSEASEESEWLSHICSRTNADIDESVSVSQKGQPENQNQDNGIASVAVKDFLHEPVCSPLLSGINRSQESVKGDLTVAMPLNNNTSDGIVLQYYETHVDSDLQAGILCTLNKREGNESLSDITMQNKYISFPPDLPQQDGEVKSDFILKTASGYTASEKFAGEDNIHSEPYIAEYRRSLAFALADGAQNKLFSSESADYDMGSSHGEYSKGEGEKSKACLHSLNLYLKESASPGSFSSEQTNTPLFRGNVEEIMQSLPEFSSQECFSGIISQKELNSYDLVTKCLDINYTETECKTKSQGFPGELGCQTETTDALMCRTSYDRYVGHTNDSVGTSEDGVNLLGHSKQALWENTHYGKNSSAQYDTNSCISEYSASLLSSLTSLPNDLLERPLDRYKTEALHSGDRKVFDLPALATGAVNQEDDKSSNDASSPEVIPPSSCSVEDFSAGMLFKATSTPELPRSPEGFTCRQYVDSQQEAFLTPHLPPVFQVQESQPFCHQPFLSDSCTSSETTLSLNMSKTETDDVILPATAPSCSELASSQMQKRLGGDAVIADRQPFASEITSVSLENEKICLAVSNSVCSSQRNLDGNESHTFESKNFYHDDCHEPKNVTSMPKTCLGNIGRNVYHSLYSKPDLQGDQNIPHLSSRVDLASTPSTNAENDHTVVCKEEMKSVRNVSTTEQQNLSVIKNITPSKYLSRNSSLSLQEPELEIVGNETAGFTSQSAKYNKDGPRPVLQSHSLSAPAIIVMSNFECPPEASSTIAFSVHSASKSLQELNMSVEPPSPTEDDLHRPEHFSKLKTDNVVPSKYKLRFQKKSIHAQRPSNCDKRNCRESTQGNHSGASPAHFPIGVAHTTNNLMDIEPGKLSNNVSLVHGCNMDASEELRYQAEATDGLLQDNKDAMHFSSSDINPYIHPWQQDERCKIGWKQYVFGSASDVSSNPPPLSLDNQSVLRCSSVDNGLNSQNSPFHSHLSSYANARVLSSTISSTEDLQGWDVAREGFESTHSDGSGKRCTSVSHDELETTPENHVTQSENCSQQSGNTSMQVDEIVLLYPSESDASFNKQQGMHTCERETQTEAPARHKRQKRHRRSFTDISARKPEASGSSLQQPSTWSSVQNLSLHLSQLLHNTSELLGNLSLQSVKDNEQSGQKAMNDESKTATVCNSYTQTTEDIGIQTDMLGYPLVKDKESQSKAEVEREPVKAQEVNVIVKVVHSDTLDLTKEKMPESKGRTLQSMPDIDYDATPKYSIESQSTLRTDSSPSLEAQKTPFNPAPVLGSPKVSPVLSSSFGSQHDESSCTVVSSPASSISLSPRGHSKNKKPVGKTGNSEIRELYCKSSVLVDRASSPILTLSASSVSRQPASNRSTGSFKGSVRHPKDAAHSVSGFRKKAVDIWHNFSSQESHIDTSSQTEMDSESTTSREGKEMCNMPGNALDKNTTKELSEKGGSKQKHRVTIDTHTAIHTKRLYHSSSTLELSGHGAYLVDDRREAIPVERSFRQIRATRRARNFSGGMKYERPTCDCESSPPKKSFESSLSELHRSSSLKSDESPECFLDAFSPQCHQTWRSQKCFSFQMPEMSDMQDADDDDDAGSDTESECNTEILLSANTSLVKTHRLRSYSLRDLPLHNKFSNWCGVKDGAPVSLTSLTRSAGDIHSQAERRRVETRTSEVEERSLFSERRAREIERLQRERAQVLSGIHLDMNQHPLTVELTEAKLNYGIGETDAQLRILQTGAGDDLTTVPIKQQLYERHRKSIEILRKQREERLQCFRRSRSLSPQKHLSFLQTVDTNQRDLDLPSRRREYLQQLRRDVVENTRVQEPKMRIQHPSEIELLLRDYQRAREETKTEIARARDKLRERAEQEKRRIREQIISQLQKEETKLKTLVSTSTLCTESTLSLSSGPTSGYISSNTTASAVSVLGKQEGQTYPEDAENSRGDTRGRSAIRNHQLYIFEQLQRGSLSETFPITSSSVERSSIQFSLPYSHRYSHSLMVSPCTFPASPMKGYEDLSKHVLATATAEVMAVCSNDLKNLYNGQATAGWKYQCVEKDVLVYYKAFSSSTTKHGFLGAGIINRPLPAVLCLLKDPSKRHLYDKTITTAQVHKKITSSVELVYVVSDVSLCYQKQPRDFCCISVEAKKENVSILAIQSVYEESMPRPCKEMVRGEILPSAWILEPDTANGRDITKVIYMVQVDLGAPAIPARLLSSIAKRQPLVIARLAHFLAG